MADLSTTRRLCLLVAAAAVLMIAGSASASAAGTQRQAITVTSDPGVPQAGTAYTPVATASSGLPVAFTVTDDSPGCFVTGTSVFFSQPGPCSLHFDQAGDDDWAPALQVTQTVQVQPVPPRLTLRVTPGTSTVGQSVDAVLTAADPGTGHPVQGTVTLVVDGVALTPVRTTHGHVRIPITGRLRAGTHTLEAQLAPVDPAYGTPDTSTTFTVGRAPTQVSVRAHTHVLVATVQASGTGTPRGRVRFYVHGRTVGSALLDQGTARLVRAVPRRNRHAVAAAYLGTGQLLASSASTAAHDPTIKAHVAGGGRSHGWYRHPVQVRFTCPAALRCPKPVRVTTYPAPPTTTCAATDTLSGVASCRVEDTVVAQEPGVDTHQYRAVARDLAGNRSVVVGRYRVLTVALDSAPYVHGAFRVALGRGYTLVATGSAGQPTYYAAVPYPQQPTLPDGTMVPSGADRWTLGLAITRAFRGSGALWNLGVRTGSTTAVVTIRVG